ncbi:MAG: hypothetical protein DRP85_08775 [Candidatus Makaraimicrobium thalassicum]|nr:MAG: hypothetical protein DRP85_08775 [Candidatus Omnitrophota bacterium]
MPLLLKKMNKQLFDKPQNFIVFDGGARHTGICRVYNLTKSGGFAKASVILQTIEHKDNTTQGYAMIDTLLSDPNLDFVLYEDFRLYKARQNKDGTNKTHYKQFSRFEEVQIIGLFKWLCDVYKLDSYRQAAVEIKNRNYAKVSFVGDKSAHSRDALHHAQIFFNKHKYSNRTLEF